VWGAQTRKGLMKKKNLPNGHQIQSAEASRQQTLHTRIEGPAQGAIKITRDGANGEDDKAKAANGDRRRRITKSGEGMKRGRVAARAPTDPHAERQGEENHK
jgi:hypothetical protein